VPNRLGSRSLSPLPLACYRTAVTLVLALVALVGYGGYAVQLTVQQGWFNYTASDFRAYYATGQIFRNHGPQFIYDSSLQSAYQRAIYDQFVIQTKHPPAPLVIIPVPYLPPFILPFVLLSYLPPFPAFVVWTFLNGTLILLYLLLWVRRLCLDQNEGLAYILLIYLSIQNFYTLYCGQVNLLLLVAVGETLFNLNRKRDFWAGTWLSMGLIKPHAILLLVLVLWFLRERRFKMGLLSGSFIVGLITLALLGLQGLKGYLNMLSSYNPLLRIGGMTWTHLVDNLGILGISHPLAFAIGIGIASIVIASWFSIMRQLLGSPVSQFRWAEIFLLTLATQSVIAPHGHVHMTLSLGIPWIVYLHHEKSAISYILFIVWGVFLGIIYVVTAQKSLGNAIFLLGMFSFIAHVLVLLVIYHNSKIKTYLPDNFLDKN